MSSGAKEARKKTVIGLIGEVCAGKSTVADAFRRNGAMVYDADKGVHEIYRKPEVIAEVKELFGTGVLDDLGQVDRKKLGQIVFKDPGKLRTLTDKVIFPRTNDAMRQTLEAFHKSDSKALLLDAPTLFEAGRDDLCHFIVFVRAPMDRRLEWAKDRGWDAEEIKRRESRLGRQSIKKRRADAVIDNTGSIEHLDTQVRELLKKWVV
jgi:dephospho-CoA kinase